MKNFGLFQFVLASSMAMFMTFPNGQITMPATDIEDDKTTFEKFLNKFQQADLPYSIDMETLALEELNPEDVPVLDEASLLGSEFESVLPAMEGGRFSRMGPDDFFAKDLLVSSDDFHILTYSRKHPFSFYQGSYVLAVFSRSGKLLDEMSFAYSYGRDGGMTGSISESLTIEISEKETVWTKDVREFGYEDNEVDGYKTTSSKFFTIDKNGKFEEMKVKKAEPVANGVAESNASPAF